MGAKNSTTANNGGSKDVHSVVNHPSVTFMLTRAAHQHPNGVATIDHFSNRTRTWSQVHERVSRLANGLKTRYNLNPGGRVGLVSLNSDRYFETFFAASYAGGIVVPINIRLAPPEMVEQFNDCTAEIVLVDDAFWQAVVPLVRSKCKSVKHVIFCGDKLPPGVVDDYEAIVKANSPMNQPLSRGGDDTFGIFYTGGTTGKSKGVELTHSNIFINALGHVGMLEYSKESKYLHSAPMFHLADGASTFGVTMACGTHVFLPKFVPDDVLDAIEKHRVNRAMMVPAMIAMMLQAPSVSAKKRDLSCLGNVMYGASPMPKALLEPALKMFPNAKFRQGYGMTETSPAITSLAPEYHDGGPRMTSVGEPVSWVEVKIVNDKGEEVPRGTVGEIVTRGPHVMKGYYGMPDKTAEALRDGWLHTQDGGYQDKDGFVFIVDRLKDMIITGGENVYSAEVEQTVMAYPDVAQCAVVGFPDPTFVEIVTAVLVLKDSTKPFDQAAFIKHCRERIANYKVPRKVVVVKELPMSGAGKILKNKVREMLGTDRMGNTAKL